MDTYQVTGGKRLYGTVGIQGSKNAALPIIAATVLHRGVTVLTHCPPITDVYAALAIIRAMGGKAEWKSAESVIIDTRELNCHYISDSYYDQMRASVLFLGAELGRFGIAEIYAPGGCMIGMRPIDLHLRGMELLGAVVSWEGKKIHCEAKKLAGARIKFAFPSVGATENVILAACMAEGITLLENCAREPEILALCDFLNAAGADIRWKDAGTLRISGIKKLQDTEFEIPGDRIVAGTYMAALAGCCGCVTLTGVNPGYMIAPTVLCRKLGCEISCSADSICIAKERETKKGKILLETAPYPGFPTDLQSIFTAVLAGSGREAVICETIFENRFQIVPELCKMGAVIENVSAHRIHICCKRKLHSAVLTAKELRGGAALLVAALTAEGTTCIQDAGYISRGYVDIVSDLRSMGADIEKTDS